MKIGERIGLNAAWTQKQELGDVGAAGSRAPYQDADGVSPRLPSGRSELTRRLQGFQSELKTLVTSLLAKQQHANANDVDAVVQEFVEHIPVALLQLLARSGFQLVVCTDSVLEHRPDLAERKVPGSNASFERVSGLCSTQSGRREIVIVARRRRTSTVPHEVGHGVDVALGRPSHDVLFFKATLQDKKHLRGRERAKGWVADQESWARGFEEELATGGPCKHIRGVVRGLLDALSPQSLEFDVAATQGPDRTATLFVPADLLVPL